jgi:hypothetical protein
VDATDYHYLDGKTARQMEASVRKAKVSKSRWIAEAVRNKCADEWPLSVKELAGAWQDFPTLEEIRAVHGKDVPRESF